MLACKRSLHLPSLLCLFLPLSALLFFSSSSSSSPSSSSSSSSSSPSSSSSFSSSSSSSFFLLLLWGMAFEVYSGAPVVMHVTCPPRGGCATHSALLRGCVVDRQCAGPFTDERRWLARGGPLFVLPLFFCSLVLRGLTFSGSLRLPAC